MPGLFALSIEVIGNPIVAAFAAFGSFAMLLLVSFGGPVADRVRAHVALALAGALLVVVGTLVSTVDWLAAIVTVVVAFGAIFAGVVSSVLASATPALLLAFILPVSLAGPDSTIPDRLAGWGMASGAALLAITLLWPSPPRDRLRDSAVAACRAIAARLRAHVAVLMAAAGAERQQLDASASADAATAALQRAFYGTPYRPTGLTTATRVLVRLVDEIGWLHPIVVQGCTAPGAGRGDRRCAPSRPARRRRWRPAPICSSTRTLSRIGSVTRSTSCTRRSRRWNTPRLSSCPGHARTMATTAPSASPS